MKHYDDSYQKLKINTPYLQCITLRKGLMGVIFCQAVPDMNNQFALAQNVFSFPRNSNQKFAFLSYLTSYDSQMVEKHHIK